MIIIGEKINTSLKGVSEAVSTKDSKQIVELARQQLEAGAQYIDVNAGTFMEKEATYLSWMVQTIQKEINRPLCLDSPDPNAIAHAMEVHRGIPMVNSISLEPDRFRDLFPIITGGECKVVALCMAETSMPTTTQERVTVAEELVSKLIEGGISVENIFVDPLIQPVAVDQRMGRASLQAISAIMNLFPGINTICGLSNISYGLPMRRLINRHFFTLAIGYGLTAAILDPTDKRLMSSLFTAEMLLGKDEYCANFIDAYEKGILTDAYKMN